MLTYAARSPSVGILGDTRFPEQTLKASSKGHKLQCFQKLFSDYSALDFTHYSDRAIAIAGLESRLRIGFRTGGRFGVFGHGRHDGRPNEDFFHRSLLWKRAHETLSLERIEFEPSRSEPLPSWSWMAYKGAIDYYNKPPHGQVDWCETVAPSWNNIETESQNSPSSSATGQHHIKARVRSFDYEAAINGGCKFHLDKGAESSDVLGDASCVIVGVRMSSGFDENKEHYVLLVRLLRSHGDRFTFERVGVGAILGRHLGEENPVLGEIH